MTVAVFSDIHGNIYALEKAIKLMEEYKVDKYLFLGDMAGYYYYQNESIELLNTLENITCIKGNHDEYFLKSLKDNNYLEKLIHNYGKSYQLLNNNISKTSMDYFTGLQENEKNEFYEAYHANPNNSLEDYIYKDTDIDFITNKNILFLGHTHHEMQRKYKDCTIINPGSIGQPRDYNQASFSIVDVKNIYIQNIRYTYNSKKLQKKVTELKDNQYLLDILKRERI